MRRSVAAVVAAMVLVGACGGGGAEYDVPAGSVQLVENAVALGTVSRSQAIDEASARVQFKVLQPGFVPGGGYRLVVIEAQLPNPIEALGNDGRSNAVAVLTWLTGRASDAETSRIDLAQFSRATEPPPGLAEADSGEEGVRFFYGKSSAGVEAAWITADRGFSLQATGPELPEEDEVRKLFASIRE
ncbi:MAG TPA: hypothetical protein VFK32_03680 [Tepidiformaceae bacterium]|nr:hypothetical protein [Tepidiformaceae bacterium]